MKLNRYIDHTNLKVDSKLDSFDKLCNEAIEYDFYAVCVAPSYVKYCKELLENSGVKLATVIGFPNGYSTSASKVFEAAQAVKDGADEIDMVINIGKVKDRDWDYIKKELRDVKAVSNILKVIIESSLLSDDEIIKMCEIIKGLKIDFVKTSTGFANGGAEERVIKMMKTIVGDSVKIKASGGIRNKKKTLEMIDAGADRIGTSSGVAIMKEDN